MKYRLIILFVSLFGFGLASCVSDTEEEIKPVMNTCNTDNVTFSGTVSTIIQTNCLPCHSTSSRSGGVDLEGYDNIKNVAVSGKLVGVISHAAGFSPMPKNRAKLPTCDIESIKKWIDDGTPQN